MAQQNNQTAEKKIGRYTYRVRKLDPWKGADLVHDVMTTFAPATGGILGALVTKGVKLDGILDGMDPADAKNLSGQLQGSIESIFRSLTKERQREWMTSMGSVTSVRKSETLEPELKDCFDETFRGHLGEMYQWLYFALMSQCEDFLGGTDGAINRVVRSIKAMGSKYQQSLPGTPIAGD